MSEATTAAFAAPGPEQQFREQLAAGRFVIQRCASCAGYLFPARQVCPHCGGIEMHWEDATGRGTVYAVTVVNRRAEDGGPYNVVLVDLAEGPRMMSRVENIDNDSVMIGLSVQARIATNEAHGPHIVFDPAGRGGDA